MTTTTRLKRRDCRRQAPAKCALCAGQNTIKSPGSAKVGHSSSFVLAIIAIELLTSQATPTHQVSLSAGGTVPFKTSFISSSDHYQTRRNNPLIPLEYAEIESQQNQQMPDSIALNSPSFDAADSMFGLDSAESNFLRLQRTASSSSSSNTNNNYKQHDDLLVASSQLVGNSNSNSPSGANETSTKVNSDATTATAISNITSSQDPQTTTTTTTTETLLNTTLSSAKPSEQENTEPQANGTTSRPDQAPSRQQTPAETSTTTTAPAINKDRDADPSVTTLEIQATTTPVESLPPITTLAPTTGVSSAATTSAPAQVQDKKAATKDDSDALTSTPAPIGAKQTALSETVAVPVDNQRDGRVFKSNTSASFEFSLAPLMPLLRTNKTKSASYGNQLLVGEKSFSSNRTKLDGALQEQPKGATTLRLCDGAKSGKCGDFLVASVPVLVGNQTKHQSRPVNEFIFLPADSSGPLSFDESTFATATNPKTTANVGLENLKAEHRQADGDGDSIDLVELDYITSDGVGETGSGGAGSSSSKAKAPEAGERASTRSSLQATGGASSTSAPVAPTSSTTTVAPVTLASNKEGQRSSNSSSSSSSTVAQSQSTSAPATAKPDGNATLITYSDSQSISVKGDNLHKGGDRGLGLLQQSGKSGAGLGLAAAATTAAADANAAQQRQPAVRKSVRENQKVMRVAGEPSATQRAAPPTTTTKRPNQQAKLEPSRAPPRSTTRLPRSQHRNYFNEPAGGDQRRRSGSGAPRTRAGAHTYSPINNGADEEEASILTRYAISPSQLSRISAPGSAAASTASKAQQPVAAAANYRRLETQPDRRHSAARPTARIGQQLGPARQANPVDVTTAEAAQGVERHATNQLDRLVTAALKRRAGEATTSRNKLAGAESGAAELQPTLASARQSLNEELLTLISSSIGDNLGESVRSSAPTGSGDDGVDGLRAPQPPASGQDSPRVSATGPIGPPSAPATTTATPAESDNRATSPAAPTTTGTAATQSTTAAAIVAPTNGTEPRAPLLDDSSPSVAVVVENSTEVATERQRPTSDGPAESRRQLTNVYGHASAATAAGAGVGQPQASADKAGESSGVATRVRQTPTTDDGMWRPDEELESGTLVDLATEYLSALGAQLAPNARSGPRAKQTKRQRAGESSATTTTTTTAGQQAAANLLPGRPGIDYPIHWQVPKTSFDCLKYERSGFYADVESNCQAYHSCHRGRGGRHTFLCPNGTLFSQELLTCDWWYNVECSASKLYAPNEHGGSSVNLDADADGGPSLLLDIGRTNFASSWRQ